MIRLAVLGTGRLGTALAGALAARGVRVAALWDRTPGRARAAAAQAGKARVYREPFRAVAAAEVVLLTVTESALPRLVGRLRRGAWQGKVALHTAGILGPEVLDPLTRRGAAVGVLHPLQSCAGPPPVWRGVRWSFGGHPLAERAAAALVRALGGRLVAWPRGDRELYHAAAALLVTGAVALAAETERLLETAGFPAAEAGPAVRTLLAGVARNVGRTVPIPAALTGPLARGDPAAVRRHVRALGRVDRGEARVLYAELARRLLGALSLPAPTRRRLRRLFGGHG